MVAVTTSDLHPGVPIYLDETHFVSFCFWMEETAARAFTWTLSSYSYFIDILGTALIDSDYRASNFRSCFYFFIFFFLFFLLVKEG